MNYSSIFRIFTFVILCLLPLFMSKQFFKEPCLLEFQTTNSLDDTKSCYSMFNIESFHHHNIYILGNSVFRHYSFTLAQAFREFKEDSMIERHTEKSICQGVLGTASCDHFIEDKDIMIRFMWKNLFGQFVAYDDLERDACGASFYLNYNLTVPKINNDYSVKDCFQNVFSESKSEDFLIIGSYPVDMALYNANKGNSQGSTARTCQSILSSNISTEMIISLLELTTSQFQGAILWVSFPLLKTTFESEQDDDLHQKYDTDYTNNCIKHINSLVEKSITMFSHDRVRYLNVNPIQEHYFHDYNDRIHHAGKLSERIVATILSYFNV